MLAGTWRVCSRCAVRVGTFLLQSSEETVCHFWSVKPVRPPAQERTPPTKLNDLQTHLNLARAYVEMGLAREALHEAALVLAADPPNPMKLSALKIVFARSIETGHLFKLGEALFQA